MSLELTKRDLRKMAKQHRVAGYKRMSKDQLMRVLEARAAAASQVPCVAQCAWEMVPVAAENQFVMWIGDLNERRIECYRRPMTELLSTSHWLPSMFGGRTQYFHESSGKCIPLMHALSKDQQQYPAFSRSRGETGYIIKPYSSLEDLKIYMRELIATQV